jgi:hypothetical protein
VTTNSLRVILEIGPERRTVAGAMDWPGLDRWGTSDDDAVAMLTSYVPRYAGVAERAGLASAFNRVGKVEVVERVCGSSSTDWWAIAHVPSQIEAEVLSAKELDRRLELLHASWDYFDDVAARVSKELKKGARGGGRERDEIVRHVYASERHNWWRKVGLRAKDGVPLTHRELGSYRRQYVESIRAYNAEGKKARTWPIQFLIRRTAHHVMDHAWEMEDRDRGRARQSRGARA